MAQIPKPLLRYRARKTDMKLWTFSEMSAKEIKKCRLTKCWYGPRVAYGTKNEGTPGQLLLSLFILFCAGNTEIDRSAAGPGRAHILF